MQAKVKKKMQQDPPEISALCLGLSALFFVLGSTQRTKYKVLYEVLIDLSAAVLTRYYLTNNSDHQEVNFV